MNEYPVPFQLNGKERALLLDSARSGRTYMVNYCTALAKQLGPEYSRRTWMQWHTEFARVHHKLRAEGPRYIVMNHHEGLALAVLFYPYLSYRNHKILRGMHSKLKQFAPDGAH